MFYVNWPPEFTYCSIWFTVQYYACKLQKCSDVNNETVWLQVYNYIRFHHVLWYNRQKLQRQLKYLDSGYLVLNLRHWQLTYHAHNYQQSFIVIYMLFSLIFLYNFLLQWPNGSEKVAASPYNTVQSYFD